MSHTIQPATESLALNILRDDHRTIAALLAKSRSPRAPHRAEMVDQALAALDVHTLVDSEIVFPALRNVAGGEEAIGLAERQRGRIDELVDCLAEVPPHGEGFDSLVNGLADSFSEHVRQEEEEIFPELAKIGHEELPRLGLRMRARRRDAPRERLEYA